MQIFSKCGPGKGVQLLSKRVRGRETGERSESKKRKFTNKIKNHKDESCWKPLFAKSVFQHLVYYYRRFAAPPI